MSWGDQRLSLPLCRQCSVFQPTQLCRCITLTGQSQPTLPSYTVPAAALRSLSSVALSSVQATALYHMQLEMYTYI